MNFLDLVGLPPWNESISLTAGRGYVIDPRPEPFTAGRLPAPLTTTYVRETAGGWVVTMSDEQ